MLAAASALMTSVAAPASALACAAPWSASAIYMAGGQASENGIVYRANWWTQNQDPAANNGGAGSGEPWTNVGSCSSCAAPPPTQRSLGLGTTSSATTLTWTAVTVPACTVTGYDVYENGALIGNPAGSSFAVSGLTPKTSYAFTVAAVDSAGASAKSAKLTRGNHRQRGRRRRREFGPDLNFHLLIGAGPAADTLTLTRATIMTT